MSEPEIDDTTDDTQTNNTKKEEDSIKTDSEKPNILDHQDSLKTPTSPADFENLETTRSCAIANGDDEVLQLNIEESCFENSQENLSNKSSPSTSSYVTVANDLQDFDEIKDNRRIEPPHAFIITDASVDVTTWIPNPNDDLTLENPEQTGLKVVSEEVSQSSLDTLQEPRSECVSPASMAESNASQEVSINFQSTIFILI